MSTLINNMPVVVTRTHPITQASLQHASECLSIVNPFWLVGMNLNHLQHATNCGMPVQLNMIWYTSTDSKYTHENVVHALSPWL